MPAEQGRVSVFDSAFSQGVGLFETMRTYGEMVFRLDHHLNRLIRSARLLGWAVLPEIDALRENVEQIVSGAEAEDARVRLTVTTGSLRASEDEPPQLTIVASASPGASYPPECYRNGVTVTIAPYRQGPTDPTVGHKTTSYFARLSSLREAHAKGAFEAIWLTHQNLLAEGAISSLFIVRDERVFTPPLDTPVLPGITRATVIEIADRARIKVEEAALTIDDLLSADEVFLTNSLMEIMPVVRVERKGIGTEKPGDVTRVLYEAYGKLVETECAYA
jgi:branched-chain amino acid aminotransferase